MVYSYAIVAFSGVCTNYRRCCVTHPGHAMLVVPLTAPAVVFSWSSQIPPHPVLPFQRWPFPYPMCLCNSTSVSLQVSFLCNLATSIIAVTLSTSLYPDHTDMGVTHAVITYLKCGIGKMSGPPPTHSVYTVLTQEEWRTCAVTSHMTRVEDTRQDQLENTRAALNEIHRTTDGLDVRKTFFSRKRSCMKARQCHILPVQIVQQLGYDYN